MKFLLDQGIPRSLKELLISEGHEAEHVSSIGMAKANDHLKLIKRILPHVTESLLSGALVSVREDSIGIRKLPI